MGLLTAPSGPYRVVGAEEISSTTQSHAIPLKEGSCGRGSSHPCPCCWCGDATVALASCSSLLWESPAQE